METKSGTTSNKKAAQERKQSTKQSQLTGWEVIFANYIADKVLISKIYSLSKWDSSSLFTVPRRSHRVHCLSFSHPIPPISVPPATRTNAG